MNIDRPEIRERLQWLIKLRWAGCVGVLVATHIVREMASLIFSLMPVYLILGFVAAYNVYFQQRLKFSSKDLKGNALQQISFDYIALAAAVYFSGGCDSPFLYYYIFHIVISGIILPRIWTFRLAFVAIALPTIIVGLKHFGFLPHYAIFRNEPVIFADLSVMASYGAVYASTLILTAYFVTYLSDKLYKKQEEISRLYVLSEKLRASIVMDEVIETIRKELFSLGGISQILYMPFDKSKMALVYSGMDDQKDEGNKVEGTITGYGLPPGELVIPLSDRNVFTDAFTSCEVHMLEAEVINSDYEDIVFSKLMKDAREIAVLPVQASLTHKCYDLFHCPEDSGCPAYKSEDRRCWYVSGTYCRGKIMRTTAEKLNECVKCDIFMPVGIFLVDNTPKSGFDSKCDLDACMRLLESASLAVSNAKLYEKTLELSEKDGLTGVKNRTSFLNALSLEVSRAQRYGKFFGLMMLDIDFFKNYNDANGHPQGDVLLKMIADKISEKMRETDMVGRYGGEEFIIMLPETTKDDSVAIAERIRDSIQGYRFPRADKQPEGRMTVSIGVSAYPEDGDSSEKIIGAADDGLYTAKALGRNRVIVANRQIVL